MTGSRLQKRVAGLGILVDADNPVADQPVGPAVCPRPAAARSALGVNSRILASGTTSVSAVTSTVRPQDLGDILFGEARRSPVRTPPAAGRAAAAVARGLDAVRWRPGRLPVR